MSREIRLHPCDCDGAPRVRTDRVAEDAIETWVECGSCGARTEEIEDAYSDAPTAAANRNAGDRK